MKMRLPVALSVLWIAVIGFGTAGCSAIDPLAKPSAAADAEGFPRPGTDEFTVMTFNLSPYTLQDSGDGSGTLVPRPESAPLIELIRQVAPDVLALQEMGDPAAWAEFKYRLRQAGLEYRYEEYLQREDQDLHQAVLSRYPIAARQPHLDDLYTIGPTQFPIQHGIVDLEIEVNPDYRLRLITAHLKNKVFHEYGQAEMRRNEARLLNNHIRAALDENPGLNLLVTGDFSDEPDSRVLREIHTYQDEPILFDLRPVDSAGDAWTWRAENDNHARTDYLLLNSGLLNEVNLAKTYVVRDPQLLNASDHRPLVATFVAREQDSESAPDLSTRRPPVFPRND